VIKSPTGYAKFSSKRSCALPFKVNPIRKTKGKMPLRSNCFFIENYFGVNG
jgi:hypothetical protein